MATSQCTCPNCQKTLKIRDPNMFGKKAKCPGCQQPFVLTPDSDVDDDDPSDWFEDPDEDDDLDFDSTPVSKPSRSSPSPGLPPKKRSGKKSSKKKKKPAEDRGEPGEYSLPVHYLMMAGTGFLGGVIGAVVWGVLAYLLPYDSDYAAILVGALVGGGVRLGASKYDYGWGPAITALLVAVFAITMGKVISVNLTVASVNAEMRDEMAAYDSRDGQILLLAQELHQEKIDSGEISEEEARQFAINFEKEYIAEMGEDDWESDEFEVDFEFMKKVIPPKVWEEAEAQYDNMSEEERDELKELTEFELEGAGFDEATSLLSVFDLFYFILAGGVAFAVAAGWDLTEQM